MHRVETPDSGPWSATLGIPGIPAADLLAWYVRVFDSLDYRHDAPIGPMEDGSRSVTASVGDGGCRLSMSFVPRDTITLVLIRYGAVCPIK